jgi:hypothetical protein
MMAWIRVGATRNPIMTAFGEWLADPKDRTAIQYGMLTVADSGMSLTDVGGVPQSVKFNFADDEWHHIVSVRDEQSRELWIDGQRLLSDTGGVVSQGPFDSLFVGAKGDDLGNPSWWFRGWIDDVRFYVRGLNSDEVQEIYRSAFCEGGKEFFTSTADCKALTRCRAGEYETQAPTATTDRLCAICPAGSAVSSDGQCRACSPGAYTADGTAGDCADFVCAAGTTDDDKNPATTCKPCRAGLTYADVAGLVACKDVSVCPAGQEPRRQATTSSDVECSVCRLGSFKVSEGNDDCSPLSLCKLGEVVMLEPTATSDRLCEPCDGSTSYSDNPSLFVCKVVSECSFGEAEIASPTATSDRECEACAAGSFKSSEGSDTSCTPCITECGAGEYLIPCEPGQRGLSSNAQCVACPTGTFTPSRGNQTECVPHRTQCASGSYIAEPGTPTSDAQCGPCQTCATMEFIQSGCNGGIENTVCGACPTDDSCGQGFFASGSCDPTSRTPPQCQACDASCLDCTTSATTCTACAASLSLDKESGTCVNSCSLGKYEDKDEETPGSGIVCKTCDTSCAECVGPEEDACISCPASSVLHEGRCLSSCDNVEGVYADGGVCKACRVCPALNAYESAPCTPTSDRKCATVIECSPGEYESRAPTPTSNRACVTCKLCEAGKYAVAGSCGGTRDTSCEPCTFGSTYQPRSGQTSCLAVRRCRPGSFQTDATLTEDARCTTCPKGQTDDDADPTTECVLCGAGLFTLQGSVGPCAQHPCFAGTADTDGNAATLCVACDGITTYQPLPGQTSCLQVPKCAPGSRRAVPPTWTTPGACTPCLVGLEYQEETDAVSCKRVSTCGDGSYAAAAPTATSDRRCEPWQRCGGDKYVAVAGTTSSDVVCEDRTVCSADDYEAEPATATSDRVCATAVTCGRGMYVAVTKTATSDRVCSLCLPGTYQGQDDANAARCTPCSDGTYAATAGAAGCMPVTVCNQSQEIEVAPPTASSNRVCHSFARLFFKADYDELLASSDDRTKFKRAIGFALSSLTYPFTLPSDDYEIDLAPGSVVATITSADDVSCFGNNGGNIGVVWKARRRGNDPKDLLLFLYLILHLLLFLPVQGLTRDVEQAAALEKVVVIFERKSYKAYVTDDFQSFSTGESKSGKCGGPWTGWALQSRTCAQRGAHALMTLIANDLSPSCLSDLSICATL